MEQLINIGITGICLMILGFYFNSREKKLQQIAESKLKEIKDKYISLMVERKAKERVEVEKLKKIVDNLEKKHKEMIIQKSSELKDQNDSKAEEVIKRAEERAKKIENEVKENAQKFLEEQKKEVQTKMVDLVMGVSKKVLVKSLSYEDQKLLIENALLEMEGEVSKDGRS